MASLLSRTGGDASNIEQLLYPSIYNSLRQDIPPVKCVIWKGNKQYETLEFDNMYPFDTIDNIKRMVCAHYKNQPIYLPRFLFIGIPVAPDGTVLEDEEIPTTDTQYLSIDYLWFPNGSNQPEMTYILSNPRKALTVPDLRFVTADGSFSSPNYEFRGRSMIEQVFLKPLGGVIPTLHVFPLSPLLKSYKGAGSMTETDWNKRFGPYFPDVSIEGPYEPTKDDKDFGEKIAFFISERKKTVDVLDNILTEGADLPPIEVSGIKQLLLTWKKPVEGFEGSAYLFYRIPVTERRPFIRLLPAEGSAITKLHVKGVLPIPTLSDPRVLETWVKETSPTPGIDYCACKYVHRPAVGITPPIYGTIQILNDGTINLLLQPPKQIKKLDPNLDFRNFTNILDEIFVDLPQNLTDFELREIAVIFSMKINIKSTKFTKSRIQSRLPYFSTFFNEIKPLPNENPLISLRFKAVSQYASEDKIFSFITQLATTKKLDGEIPDIGIIDAIQNEFQFSKKDATDAFAEWFKKRGTFTLQLPEEGEFIESFNAGIDIHVYASHPLYFFHVNRVDNYYTYIRIYTLLSLLFMEDDSYFLNGKPSDKFTEVEDELENDSLRKDGEYRSSNSLDVQSQFVDRFADEEENIPYNTVNTTTASSSIRGTFTATKAAKKATFAPIWNDDDPFADEADQIDVGEVLPETAPGPIELLSTTAAKPATKASTALALAALSKKETTPAMTVDTAKRSLSRSEPQKLVNPKSWFIKKLQEIDPRLFDYKTDDSEENGYSRKCASNDDRQPIVLDTAQYDKMRAVYEDDNIFWIVYPLDGTEDPIQPLSGDETITIMRYGSDNDAVNYYFCPQYYCLNDEIMVRARDFEATKDRDNNPKPPNTCPFCYGKLIIDKKRAVENHTVIRRKDKKGSTEYHKYIDFLSKTSHPENFALPCCFVKQTSLRIADKQFSHLRDFLQKDDLTKFKAASNDDDSDDTDSDAEDDTNVFKNLLFKATGTIEYAVLFETIHKRYILESNKHPDPAIFAILPHKFDNYFRQNSSEDLVTRVAIYLKLRPNAQGFLRIGTDNNEVYESLLGVIAPLIYKNSIKEVKERIYEVVVPRVFLNSHFGNLVLEFYNPADGRAMPPTKQELMAWSQKNLGIALNSINTYQLIRVYNAYKRFIKFIEDPRQRKELRHLQPLLAEPGLFTSRGIQLIILEDKESSDVVSVKCPVFGVSADRNKQNDFAFISRSEKMISSTDNTYSRYELFIHTSNTPAKGGHRDIHETIVRWDYRSRRGWPEIVKIRIDEYMKNCQSRYRSVYTSHGDINPMALIPLSKAVDDAPFRPEGIIKDSYNHIVAVTFRAKPGSSQLVALPIVDDGIISISMAFNIKSIYLDWMDFKMAPVEDVVKYYRDNLEPMFTLYPGYYINYIVRNSDDNKVVAVQLKNGIYVPVAHPKNEDVVATLGLGTVTVSEFEWMVNTQFSGILSKVDSKSSDWNDVIESALTDSQCGSDPELTRETSYEDFEELYQNFRLMVSNWIVGNKAGGEVREGIADIIFNEDLPDFEKRKRLYIFLSSTLLSWIYPDENKKSDNGPVSFLRKDCRVINSPESCTGSCHWNSNSGKCLLHVNSTTGLSEKTGERDVSTAELFVQRIIDELVRFPNRRKQLMKKDEVSKVSIIIKPIRQGSQYIIPESSPTWTNLLRLDWSKQIQEQPRYYEEMSRDEAKYDDEVKIEGNLPDDLQELFKNTEFVFKSLTTDKSLSPLQPLTVILRLTLEQLGVEDNATTFNSKNLINYVKLTGKAIGMINLTESQYQAGLNEEEYSDIIQFVRPGSGAFNELILLVFLANEMGIIMQEEGNSNVTIDSLPNILKERWESAGIINLKSTSTRVAKSANPAKPITTATSIAINPIVPPVLIGKNPIMRQEDRRPLVASRPVIKRVSKPVSDSPEEVVVPRPVIKRVSKPVSDSPEEVVVPRPSIKRVSKPVSDSPEEVVVPRPSIKRVSKPVSDSPEEVVVPIAPTKSLRAINTSKSSDKKLRAPTLQSVSAVPVSLKKSNK